MNAEAVRNLNLAVISYPLAGISVKPVKRADKGCGDTQRIVGDNSNIPQSLASIC